MKQEYEDFIQRQTEIYLQSFRGDEQTILTPHKQTVQGTKGYLIAWTYPIQIADLFSAFGRNVARIVPALCYGSAQLHTIVTDFLVSPTTNIEETVLKRLCDIVDSVEYAITRPRIRFSQWVFGKNSVIIPGYADDYFLESGFRIQEAGQKKGLELRLPWGSHITIARFSEEVTDIDKIHQLQKLMSFSPSGEVVLSNMVVGSFALTKDCFNITVKKHYGF